MSEKKILDLYQSMDRFREIQRIVEEGVPIEEQVDLLNERQNLGAVHPLTCDRSYGKCETKELPKDIMKDGVLIATKKGWICPCGRYTQNF